MDPLRIPECWTAEQALQVVDLLEQIVQAIWNRHGWSMGQLLQDQYDPLDPALLPPWPDHEEPDCDVADPDDDIPF